MTTLSLAQANKIIDSALKRARELKLQPLAVVVLDESGHSKAVQREDEAHTFRIDVALGKAWAAGAMGESSRTVL